MFCSPGERGYLNLRYILLFFFPATKATNGKHFNDENVFDVLNLLNMEEGWPCVWPLQWQGIGKQAGQDKKERATQWEKKSLNQCLLLILLGIILYSLVCAFERNSKKALLHWCYKVVLRSVRTLKCFCPSSQSATSSDPNPEAGLPPQQPIKSIGLTLFCNSYLATSCYVAISLLHLWLETSILLFGLVINS